MSVDAEAGLQPPLRWLLRIAFVLVLVAGAQLFVGSTSTDRTFAWTITEPLTAATLGALYWGSAVLVFFMTERWTWREGAGALAGVFAFTTLTLVATLLHLDAFHLGGERASAVFAGWAWLVVYIAVPPAIVVAVLAQVRRSRLGLRDTLAPEPGEDGWLGFLRWPILVVGALIAVVGAVMFLAPGTAVDVWLWPLTPLTSQALGAWAVGTGLPMLLLAWAARRATLTGAALTALTLSVLLTAALARFSDHVDWSRISAWVYVVVLGALLVLGLTALVVSRAPRSSEPPVDASVEATGGTGGRR